MRKLRVLAAVTVATAALLGSAGSASAASADPFAVCKDGGFVNYKDPLTGKLFANQGRCVSTLARGGALVPVAPAVSIRFQPHNLAGSGVYFYIDGPAGTYPVTVVVDGVVTQVFDWEFVGEGRRDIPLTPGAHEVSVTIEDQIFTRTIVIPEPVSYTLSSTVEANGSCTAHLVAVTTPGSVHTLAYHLGYGVLSDAVTVVAGPDGTFKSDVSFMPDEFVQWYIDGDIVTDNAFC